MSAEWRPEEKPGKSNLSPATMPAE